MPKSTKKKSQTLTTLPYSKPKVKTEAKVKSKAKTKSKPKSTSKPRSYVKAQPCTQIEQELFDENKDLEYIIGIDESNRGGWVGETVVCAYARPRNIVPVPGVRDSKKTNGASERQLLTKQLMEAKGCLYHRVEMPLEDIANLNISGAIRKGMNICASALIKRLNLTNKNQVAIYVDGSDETLFREYSLFTEYNSTLITKGDSKHYSIAAASIMAKTRVDELMQEYHKMYPEYCFVDNSGYGVKDHRKLIKQYGVTPLHREKYKTDKITGVLTRLGDLPKYVKPKLQSEQDANNVDSSTTTEKESKSADILTTINS